MGICERMGERKEWMEDDVKYKIGKGWRKEIVKGRDKK